MIRKATTDEDILQCRDAIIALRPHLEQADMVALIRSIMKEDGYELLYIPAEDGSEKAACIAGFRYQRKLHSGRTIYIDDLSTLPEYRGKGYASTLLDHIHTLALEQGLDHVELDSGHHRSDAHRLYLNKGYRVSAHHFSRPVR